MPYVVPNHPEVNWVPGVRHVDDGQVISSAGVTAGVDATLYTVQRFFGRATALETAARIGYPHTRFLDDPTFEVPAYSDAAFLPNLFRLGRAKIGLYLYDGVDEIALSSVTDTYPRAFATDVLTVALEFCTSATSVVRSSAIRLHPAASAWNSSRRWSFKRLEKSPLRITSTIVVS
jgi:hypothetical protein